MSQDYKESLEIDKLTAETEKLNSETEKLREETNKLRGEILKINSETTVARRTGLRFWLGTIVVPVFVAAATVTIVLKSHYFDGLEVWHKIEVDKFTKDTVAFSIRRESLKREEDSITLEKDSVSNLLNKMSLHLSLLAVDSERKANIIASLTNQIRNGVTPNATVNAIARKNDSLQNVIYRQNRLIDDRTEKTNFVVFSLGAARAENKLLTDSIGKIYAMHRYFLDNDFDLAQKRFARSQEDLNIQKIITQMVRDSLEDCRKQHK